MAAFKEKPNTNTAAAWLQAAAEQEHKQNTARFGEIRAALLGRLPVEWRGVTYRRLSAIIYRRNRVNGGFQIAVEMEDPCGHSVTIASPREVNVPGAESFTESDQPEINPPQHLMEPLKTALLDRIPIVCSGEEYSRVFAILFRMDDQDKIFIQAELESIRDRRIVTVTPVHVERRNIGTCDEFYEIITGEESEDA